MNFILHLTKSESEQTQAEKIAAESVIQMSSARFAQLVKDLSGLGTVCRITTNSADSTANFEVAGEDANANICLGSGKDEGDDGDESIDQKITVKKDVDMKFTLRYLILFSKASSLSDQVRLELANGNPAKVSFEFGEGAKISFLLACSVEGEEDEGMGDDQNNDEDDV